MKTLSNCKDMLGRPLSAESIKRIKRFLADPTAENWDDIMGIVVRPSGRVNTIWQALLEVDPSFPRVGRTVDTDGRVVKEWERVPTPLEVLRAIRNLTDINDGRNRSPRKSRRVSS